MDANQYQLLASRTINKELTNKQINNHATFGMVGEIGEICSLYQKKYQGHKLNEEWEMSELGDLLWFIAEKCTAKGWKLSDVMQHNIDKLIKRYPEGFSEDKSLHREEGDI